MSLFLPSIPQPSDNLDFSQGQLLSNNNGLDTVFGIDHFKFSDATANKGKHMQCHLVERLGPTIPTTAADEGAIYTKLSSAIAPFTPQTELFWRSENNGAEVQLTFDTPSVTANGYTFLAGGVLLQWGAFTISNGSTQQAVTFPVKFPNALFSITLSANTSIVLGNVPTYLSNTQTGFTGNRDQAAGNTIYTYMALGN